MSDYQYFNYIAFGFCTAVLIGLWIYSLIEINKRS
jgi:hypothetical protein